MTAMLLVLVSGLSAVVLAAAQENAPAPRTVRDDAGRAYTALDGRLSVPESRARPDGRRIELAYVRVQSPAPEPGVPIVFLNGGPGQPATPVADDPGDLGSGEAARVRKEASLIGRGLPAEVATERHDPAVPLGWEGATEARLGGCRRGDVVPLLLARVAAIEPGGVGHADRDLALLRRIVAEPGELPLRGPGRSRLNAEQGVQPIIHGRHRPPRAPLDLLPCRPDLRAGRRARKDCQ